MEEIATVYHADLETPLFLSPDRVQLLIVENPGAFYRFVGELLAQMDGGEGNFRFLRAEQPISPEKEGAIVSDPFRFDLNDKKLVNALWKKLSSVCRYGPLYGKLSEINGKISAFFGDLFAETPFALEYDELEIEALLKSASVRFERNALSLPEKIVCYINALVELCGCRFFLFVNLKSVLSDEELRAIYHHCALEKIGLLLIERDRSRPLLSEEKAVIITDDLCEILENYGEM